MDTITLYRMGEKSPGSRAVLFRLAPVHRPFIILAVCVLVMSYLPLWVEGVS